MNNPPPSAYVDEVFAGAGTFYRRFPIEAFDVKSLHVVSAADGTNAGAAGTVTVEHSDVPAPVATSTTFGSFDPSDATYCGWGAAGAATTVGASQGRYWKQDVAVGSLTVASATDATGGARVDMSNVAARWSRFKIEITTPGRLIIAGSGSR